MCIYVWPDLVEGGDDALENTVDNCFHPCEMKKILVWSQGCVERSI